jgi:carboxypeptidase family protein/TonB-dependent receptor-like protein
MKIFRFRVFVMVGFIAISLSASLAIAQLPTATILGVVKDQTGAVIPGATITATNENTGASRTTISGEGGNYRFAALPVGTYALRAELDGFRAAVKTGLQLTIGQEAVLDFALEVGATAETVEVTAEAPLVNTTSGSLGSLVGEDTIADLPLNGRNYQDLALLQTGVVQNQEGSGRTANGTQFSSNGAPVRSNLFMIDGTIMNDVHGYGGASTNDTALGVEGIREFKVVTNAFSAEYGMTMGSQITIVTKGGTNQVHGSLFEYLRNSALDARNWNDIPDKAPLRQNNFGGSLGGPIINDRLFYFGTYEGQRIRRSMSPAIGSRRVPTMAARNGDINGDGIVDLTVAPAVKPYLQYWPVPNDFDPLLASQGIGIYNFISHPKAREDYYQGRIDYVPGNSDNLFGRYTLSDSENEGNDPILRPDLANSKYLSRNQWATVSDSHTFSPALLSTLRASYSRTNTYGTNRLDFPRDLSFVPGEKLGGFGISQIADYTNLGPNSEFGLHQTLFSASADIFDTHGKHALKFGTLMNFYSQFVDNRSGADPRGLWSFTDLASFLRGQATQFATLTPGSITARTWNYDTLGYYFQDDFKASQRLTLNLGMRYEFTTQVKEAHGHGAALRDIVNDASTTPGIPFKNATLRNFSPRFGFAYDLFGDGKTAVRGGAALLYDIGVVGSSFFIASSGTPPLSSRSVVNNPPPAFGPYPVIPASAVGKTIRTIDYNLKQPKLYSYNLTIERQLPWSIALTTAYAGSRGFHLMTSPEGNPIIPQGTPSVVNGQRTCLNVFPSPVLDPSKPHCWIGSSALTPGPIASERRINLNWDAIDFRNAESLSWYDSLQIGLLKRLSRGVQFQSSYTWSHTLDEGQGQGQDAGGGACQDAFDRAYCKGAAGIDRRHVWNFNALYRVPSKWSGVAGKFLNGWWASTIVTWNSGTPFTPSMAFNRALTTGPAGSGGSRPDLRPGFVARDITRGVSKGCLGVPQGTPLGTPLLFFDPCAFSIPARGFLGNLGRNTLYGPNYNNVNFSLVKDSKLPMFGENTALEFRTEVFNIFNHPSFSNPSAQVFTARTNTALPYEEIPVATVGRIGGVRGTGRELQFALKITF